MDSLSPARSSHQPQPDPRPRSGPFQPGSGRSTLLPVWTTGRQGTLPGAASQSPTPLGTPAGQPPLRQRHRPDGVGPGHRPTLVRPRGPAAFGRDHLRRAAALPEGESGLPQAGFAPGLGLLPTPPPRRPTRPDTSPPGAGGGGVAGHDADRGARRPRAGLAQPGRSVRPARLELPAASAGPDAGASG